MNELKGVESGGRGNDKYRLSDMFIMVRDGKPKSTLLLYSFSLSFIVVALYASSFFLLLNYLELLLADSLPAYAVNLMESIICSLPPTAVCVLIARLIKDIRIVPMSFLFAALYALALFIWLIVAAFESISIIIPPFFWFAVIPIIIGGTSVTLYVVRR